MSEAETVEVEETVEKKTFREVLFFELETVATGGREAMFEAVKKVMKSKDIEVTPALFGKCGITARPGAAIQAMIDDSGRNLSTGDQLATQAEKAMKKFFTAEAELNVDLPAVIKAAQKKDIEVVAISAWPEDVAEALMKKLGLDDQAARTGHHSADRDCKLAFRLQRRADRRSHLYRRAGQVHRVRRFCRCQSGSRLA